MSVPTGGVWVFGIFNPNSTAHDGVHVYTSHRHALPPRSPPPPVLNFKLEDTKRNSEKLIDTLKAVLEETDIRIADLKKEAYEFKRDIVVGAENMRTGNTMAEKVKHNMGMDLNFK